MTDEQAGPLSPNFCVRQSQEPLLLPVTNQIEETPRKKRSRNIGGLLPAFQMLLKKSHFDGEDQNEAENATPSKKIRSLLPSKQSVSRSLFDSNVASRLALSTLQGSGSKPLEIVPKPFCNSKPPVLAQQKPSNSKRSNRSSSPQRKKAKFGKINCGVSHGIRKPKPQPKSSSGLNSMFIKMQQDKKDKKEIMNSKNKQSGSDGPSAKRSPVESSWASDDVWPEEDHLHSQVDDIVEQLTDATDITSKHPFIVQSDEQLNKITQLIQVAQIGGSEDILQGSSPMGNTNELAPLDNKKIQEVEDLIDQLLGTSDEIMDKSDSETVNFKFNELESLAEIKIVQADSAHNADKVSTENMESIEENNTTMIPNEDQQDKGSNSDESMLNQSCCFGFNSDSEENQKRLQEMENLVEKLNNSSYIDPNDTDPFEGYDTDELILSSDTSNENIVLCLDSDDQNWLQSNCLLDNIPTSKVIIKQQQNLNSGSISVDIDIINAEKSTNSKEKVPDKKDIDISGHPMQEKSCSDCTKEKCAVLTTETENIFSDQNLAIESRLQNTTNDSNPNSDVNFTAGENSLKISSKEPETKSESTVTLTTERKASSTAKIFPVFIRGSSAKKDETPPKPTLQRRRTLPVQEKDGKEQLLLDAGQKRFGSEMCDTCGFLYDPDDRKDAEAHFTHHNRHETRLRHLGWQNERVVADFKKDGRILMIKSGDPSSWWRRVSTILESVNYDLGFIEESKLSHTNSKVFLYIREKNIVGCVVAEGISCANRMLPTPEALCSEETFPAVCGVVRVWTTNTLRRKGFATKLMNALRENFLSSRNLEMKEIAFSSPTANGREFAAKYTGTPKFLVY